MVEDDPRSKKSKFIEAYLNQRENEHQKVYAQPAAVRPVEPANAYPWSRPLPVREERQIPPPVDRGAPPVERISVKDLALKRARPYLRPDQEQEEVRPSIFQKPEPQGDKYPSLLAKRRPGFKLVKEGPDIRQPPATADAKRKRLCLYDLYAPRMPSEDGSCPPPQAPQDTRADKAQRPVEREPPQDTSAQEPAREEQPSEEEPQDEEQPAQMSAEEREEVKDIAESVLWGTKKKSKPGRQEQSEKPILKIGPARKAAPVQVEVQDTEAHEEPKSVEEAAPPAESPMAEQAQDKGAGGEFCVSCGTKYTDHIVPQICTSCGAIRCTKCNSYDHEHVRTSIYYDYKFDWPLCITCYSKAFSIQKQLSKALVCYGNGNMTYALYYAQNALRMDPNSKYVPDAEKLLARIDQAKNKREAIDKAWREHSAKISRAKFQDPAWQQQQAQKKK